MNAIPHRIFLTEEEMPKAWYNLRADMPEQHDPLLDPATREPVTLEALSHIFCRELAAQELDTTHRYIPIPEPVLEYYKTYRPSPLVRAYGLERQLGTPARIYYKFEGGNTSGSHKLNSAVAQVYYAKQQGITHLTTETGAGQWGTALAMACAYFGLELTVYMVKSSARQKPQRRAVMGAIQRPCGGKPQPHHSGGPGAAGPLPGKRRQFGLCHQRSGGDSGQYAQLPLCAGQRVRSGAAASNPSSAANARIAMDRIGEYPDIVIGCAGGGSNLGGILCEYMADRAPGPGPAARLHRRPNRRPAFPDPWPLRLRLLRRRPDRPAGQDVYPGQRVQPVPQPRRRPAVPRHEPGDQQAVPRWLHRRGQGLGPDPGVRSGPPLRRGRRHPAQRRNPPTPSAPPFKRRSAAERGVAAPSSSI